MKGDGKGWRGKRATCLRGHLFTGLRRNPKRRYCVYCNRNRFRTTGTGSGYKRFRSTCDQGHPYEGENLRVKVYMRGGVEVEHRQCVTCLRATWNRYNAKRREAVAA